MADMNQGNTALLIIDVQQGLFWKRKPIYKARELLDNIHMLVRRAHKSGVPVFYIQHSNEKTLQKDTPNWQLHHRLNPLEIDHIIHKQHGNAFEDTPLEAALKSYHVTKLVIMGLVTDGCVKATCLGARQLDYDVTLVQDGHSSYSKDAGRLIDKWNRKLAAQNCELKTASQVTFSN
jgi:nicotinamidase-related amidase